jgi:hypothetical protein
MELPEVVTFYGNTVHAVCKKNKPPADVGGLVYLFAVTGKYILAPADGRGIRRSG